MRLVRYLSFVGGSVLMACLHSLCTTFVYAEIFSKTQRNGILQTKPGVIHFSGYEVGKVQQQTLVSRVHESSESLSSTTNPNLEEAIPVPAQACLCIYAKGAPA